MSKKIIISASYDAILKLKALAKEKEDVRKKLAVTAMELKEKELRKILTDTYEESKCMTILVRNFLDLSKLTLGKLLIPTQNIKKSALNKGSTFAFTLPISATNA